MYSEIRSKLKDYIGRDCVFIAYVHSYDKSKRHLILNDVRMVEDDEDIKISPHLHIHNCDYSNSLFRFNVIVFEATIYSYNRSNSDGYMNCNYALEDIKNINVMEGDYYE